MTADSNEAQATGAARIVQCWQKADIESDKVLEEIWHTAGRRIPTFSFRRRYSLFGNACTTLLHMKDDAFGACLCCRKPVGFKPTLEDTVDAFVHSMPKSSRPQ